MKRIVIVLPCCIGDVVMATAALKALRRTYPNAHITWAVGSWSKAVIAHHPLLDSVIDTGPQANPARSAAGLVRVVRLLRAGQYDTMISLVRSPLMSIAALLSGIPVRAGLDSAGRGFGYTHRTPVAPVQARAEGDIYLDVPRVLGINTEGCWANIPVLPEALHEVKQLLDHHEVRTPFFVVNPAGGNNPGMVMDAKRWPPTYFADLINRREQASGWTPVLIAGPKDGEIIAQVQQHLNRPAHAFVGTLSFMQIAALAQLSQFYVGNDTGLSHLAAAAGARTAVIFGPSDPVRYTPFVPDALALWKPSPLNSRGVAAGTPQDWEWARDGIDVDTVENRLQSWLNS